MAVKTTFVQRSIEKLNEKFSSRRTQAKLPHFYEGDIEVGDKDPITKNLIGVIEEFRASFNNLYDEVELVKNYIHDAFGDDSSLASSQGAKGDRGLRGYKGNKGDTGSAGAKGDKGDKGNTGSQGIQGLKGDTGSAGSTGSPGAKGDKGDKGDKGNPGTNGSNGAKGDKGDKGDKGNTGATGNSHLSNVTSITFNSKGQLEVVISGTTKKFNASK